MHRPNRLEVRSSLPGRIRWGVPGLKGDLRLASSIEQALRAFSWVTSVEANPVTGRVLVHFAPRKRTAGTDAVPAVLARTETHPTEPPHFDAGHADASHADAGHSDAFWFESAIHLCLEGHREQRRGFADNAAGAPPIDREPTRSSNRALLDWTSIDWSSVVLNGVLGFVPLPLLPKPSWKLALAGAGTTLGLQLIRQVYRNLKGGSDRPTGTDKYAVSHQKPRFNDLQGRETPDKDRVQDRPDRPDPSNRAGENPALEYLRPYRRSIYLATSLSLANKVLDLLPPLILGSGFNILLGKPSGLLNRLHITGKQNQLIAVGAASLGTWVLDAVLEYLQEITWRQLSQQVKHDLRSRAYAHVQTLDMEYFERHPAAELEDAIKGDAEEFGNFLAFGPDVVIQTATGMVLVCTFFAIKAPGIAVVNAGSIPVVLLASKYLQKRRQPHYDRMRREQTVYARRLGSNVRGMGVIKNFTAEDNQAELVEETSRDLVDKTRGLDRISTLFSPVIRTIVALNYLGTFTLGGAMTLNGRLTPGMFSSIMFLSQRLLWPLTNLGRVADSYQSASASLLRLDKLFARTGQTRDGNVVLATEDVKGDIRFDNVSFSYDSETEVIKRVTLQFQPGKTTALVGATGSGKTSLMKLILRFYDPDRGSILLDGHPVDELKLDDLRRAVGLVSQDVILFHGTIRENITFGMARVPHDEVVRAAHIARAHDFIQALPDRYDTLIGEAGVRLSGGQRQRISVARTILRKSPILILDEATSAFDRHTELEFYEALETLSYTRTRIVIAHRLFSIQNADWIYVIDDGTICEQGTHESLIDENRLYASMWRAQNRPPLLRDASLGSNSAP
ncbi:MAG: ABC transporter ATP-binding protein/permease [Proteobacteria bacterium]|nr:ABC transporter ATP-binding protein/permease [Pseudomonadota bacterium]